MNLRNQAIAIWKSAIAAVDSEVLVRRAVRIENDRLCIGSEFVDIATIGHIEVVGAGKAGSGMASAVEAEFRNLPPHITYSGWVNVPEDCVQPLEHITLHAARPAGVNEPTAAGVRGTEEILRRLGALSEDDLCLVLISGGGSALLPAPESGISLEDKLQVTRLLAAAGAPIHDLNCVRSQLSRIKGGGLLRACAAKRVIALIISDVIGDPLDVIASGPTVASEATPGDALDVLKRYEPGLRDVPESVVAHLQSAVKQARRFVAADKRVCNLVIGNNQTALGAAAKEAERRGFRIVSLGSQNSGQAADFGRSFFSRLQSLKSADPNGDRRDVCLLAGGETTVRLADTIQPRRGGRNQELVLAAIAAHPSVDDWTDIALLSGGTDGEDGPTPAAGAFADEAILRRMQELQMHPDDYLSINNSYAFFEQLRGLLLTGPTHTNVMDVQVGLVSC
ncbi:MAG: DUF4147 domain-containing protein [Planctomycetaceae bacterium]